MDNKIGFKKSISNFLEEKLLPLMAKMGTQRHLASIRDGFATITPLIIAGAVSLLIVTAVFGGEGSTKISLLGQIANWSNGIDVDKGGEWVFTPGWGKASEILSVAFLSIKEATIGLIALWFTFIFGYYLSKTRKFDNPISAGMVSLAAFMIVTSVDKSFFGPAGSFIGIIIGIAATELYVWITKFKKLEIKMPRGVPPAVGKSFQKLLPIIIVLVIIASVDTFIFWLPVYLNQWGYHSSIGTFGFGDVYYVEEGITKVAYPTSEIHFGALIYYAVIGPFLGFASNDTGGLWIGILYVFLVTFIWYFGLHGANVLDGVFGTLFLTLTMENAKNIGNPDYKFAIINDAMIYSFVIIGGAGAVLGMLISILIFSKSGDRKIAKYAIGGTIFQINEPVLFGIPIVLNPIYFIPFIIVQPILLIFSWIVIKLGLVSVSYIQIPWTTPPILSGLLSTGFDWRSIILSIINIAFSTIIYTPFIFLSNKIYKKKKEEINNPKILKENKV